MFGRSRDWRPSWKRKADHDPSPGASPTSPAPSARREPKARKRRSSRMIAREMGQERGHAVRMGRALAQARFRKRRSNLLLAAAQILVNAGYREEAPGPALAVNTTLTVWDNSNAMAGRLLLTLDRPDEAAAAARRAIAFDPSDYAAHRILGEIHEQAGEWTEAQAAARTAVALAPQQPRFARQLVAIERRMAQKERPAAKAPGR